MKTIRIILVAAVLLCGGATAKAFRATSCRNRYSNRSVIEHVQRKGLLLLPAGWTLKTVFAYPSMAPTATYNEHTCLWTVVSRTFSQGKGVTRESKSYTVEKIQTVTVLGETGKIISCYRQLKRYRNYE